MKFNTTEWREFNAAQWEQRMQNSFTIGEQYGSYCPNDMEPMCPTLNEEQQIAIKDWDVLLKGDKVPCMKTGDRTARCGVDDPWLNKTVWPLIRGPFCNALNVPRYAKFPMPPELLPYHDLGYIRVDPTKSRDAAPFDGGSSTAENSILWFDPEKVKDHFLKFEAMLDHYYEGLSQPLLEDAFTPRPDDELYSPMIQAYADQISRIILRHKERGKADDGIVIGVLGDSVTSGTDNCYFDAWPEQFRRQMAPLFGSMGINVQIRNAAKNGGWLLAPQMLCANDMLGGSSPDTGLDFLFQNNLFVKAHAIDAEHLIRRALFGPTPTLVSMTTQDGMSPDEFVQRYSSAGFVSANKNSYDLVQLKMPKGYMYWFPDPGRGFWGMKSDGFCRQSTRSGSSPVVNRNWHWGPLIHQTYADSYGLLFSRATRLAIDDLIAGKMPPDPPKIEDYEPILNEDRLPTIKNWKKHLLEDMKSNDRITTGIGGVHCAIGSANQPGSTLLYHWLNPVEGSPFEITMKLRNGVSYVPLDHYAAGSSFYTITSPISNKNEAVALGDWVADPVGFGAEAPRTAEQCRHVDGSTMVNMFIPDGTSWLTWKVPQRSLSIGRIMICHPRSSTKKLDEYAFNSRKVRFHYAVPDVDGEWKVVEDTQMNQNRDEECTVIVNDMNAADKAAAWEGGLWVAVEWKKEAIFDFDYLVAM